MAWGDLEKRGRELERAKIRSRTLQGRKAKANQGGMPGGFHITYGYDYQKANGKQGGRRVINETEAYWVRQMFSWLVVDGMTTGAIVKKLIENKAPTKKGSVWTGTYSLRAWHSARTIAIKGSTSGASMPESMVVVPRRRNPPVPPSLVAG
jgi:DNA invertase Pin-like site-specific DNA recombinase